MSDNIIKCEAWDQEQSICSLMNGPCFFKNPNAKDCADEMGFGPLLNDITMDEEDIPEVEDGSLRFGSSLEDKVMSENDEPAEGEENEDFISDDENVESDYLFDDLDESPLKEDDVKTLDDSEINNAKDFLSQYIDDNNQENLSEDLQENNENEIDDFPDLFESNDKIIEDDGSSFKNLFKKEKLDDTLVVPVINEQNSIDDLELEPAQEPKEEIVVENLPKREEKDEFINIGNSYSQENLNKSSNDEEESDGGFGILYGFKLILIFIIAVALYFAIGFYEYPNESMINKAMIATLHAIPVFMVYFLLKMSDGGR